MKPLKMDGRIWLGIILLLWLAPGLVIGREVMTPLAIPSVLRGDPGLPPFFDALNITTGVECSLEGYDVLVVNPCDPMGRPMNYPRVWLALAHFGPLGTSSLLLGGLIGVAFLSSLAAVFRPKTSWQLAAAAFALCSPAAVLAINRGNNDLVVFALLVAAAAASTRSAWAGGGLALAASALKVYPAAAIPFLFVCGRPQKERRWAILASLAAAALVLAGMLPDLQKIANVVPQERGSSFGAAAASFVFPWLHPWGASLVALVVGSAAWLHGRFWQKASREAVQPLHAALFSSGFLVFAAVYVTGVSWAYRLVFLLLAFPLLWSQTESDSAFERKRAWAVLLLAGLMMWAVRYPLLNLDLAVGLALLASLSHVHGSLHAPSNREPGSAGGDAPDFAAKTAKA